MQCTSYIKCQFVSKAQLCHVWYFTLQNALFLQVRENWKKVKEFDWPGKSGKVQNYLESQGKWKSVHVRYSRTVCKPDSVTIQLVHLSAWLLMPYWSNCFTVELGFLADKITRSESFHWIDLNNLYSCSILWCSYDTSICGGISLSVSVTG